MKLALRRVEQLEREVRQVMTQAKSAGEGRDGAAGEGGAAAEADSKAQPSAIRHHAAQPRDRAARSEDLARLGRLPAAAAAPLHRRAHAGKYRFARYVEDWRQKIERIGDLNYPQAARDQRLHGSLVVTVAISADGTVEQIDINRPSGHKILDEARGASWASRRRSRLFPPDIAKDVDILHITRTWTFTTGTGCRNSCRGRRCARPTMTDSMPTSVIGNPVAHSKSPLIHAEFARQTGQDLGLRRAPRAEDAFEVVVRAFRAARRARPERDAARSSTARYALATRAPRAPSTRWRSTRSSSEGSAIHGDNTDGVGLVRDLTVNLGVALRGRRILLMGAGGASYGVCGPLLDEGPAALVVANRTIEKAIALAGHFASVPRERRGGVDRAATTSFAAGASTSSINATSAGLDGDMPALPAASSRRDALAYDMVYGRSTPFLEFAARAGARVADGLGMLVEQAAESFHVWRGVRPETAPASSTLLRQC